MMFYSLESAIQQLFGMEMQISERSRVFGGDANDTFRLTLKDGTGLFMKVNTVPMLSSFQAEAEGLLAIGRTGKIGTPKVLATGTDPEGFSFLLQELLVPGRKIREYWERFGEELAAMHLAPIPPESRKGFGFAADNFIGAGKQINTWHSSWIDFFRECRLVPQLRAAERYLDKKDRSCSSFLLDHLDRYLIEPSSPSLIHGDLWAGNAMTGPDGKAWIIDPAVYYGHPEADIAMTELFGGFAPAFYSTYFSCANTAPGYSDRKDLYNLYHLLNHLNLFGSAYLPQVRSILRRYSSV